MKESFRKGIWGADIQPQALTHMWAAFQWNSADEVRRLRTFAVFRR